MPAFKFLVTELLSWPFAIKLAHRLFVVGIDARGLGQVFYVIPIGFFSVAHHQALERGIGFNDRAIDAESRSNWSDPEWLHPVRSPERLSPLSYPHTEPLSPVHWAGSRRSPPSAS